jgi:adenine-specific DNA-methyltransferase
MDGDPLELDTKNKKLGRYYTPRPVAQALADWAIVTSQSTVFDPSFGGCAFLTASMTTLSRRGSTQPAKSIYGVDIDPDADKYLSNLINLGAESSHFRTGDFLRLRPREMPNSPYLAVLGNPPYIRHHDLIDKFGIRKALNLDDSSQVSARSSYWVYFLVHSLKFLAPKGRMAMVLPGSFLHSDYAADVRQVLLKAFESIAVVVVQERLFHDAQESSVLLLAKGHTYSNREIRLGFAASVKGVREVCGDIERNTRLVKDFGRDCLISALIKPSVFDIFENLKVDDRTVSLDQVADIRIGTVTGSNSFFTMSDASRRHLGIPQRLTVPIVSRASCLQGMNYDSEDYKRLLRSEARSQLLMVSAKTAISRHLANYLRTARKREIKKRYKCQNRTPWYSVRSVGVPDAFLHYMSARGPHLVLNKAKVTCTNTIHALFWKTRVSDKTSRCIALASMNTLFRLSAELLGRSYGGGVLKLEPSEAKGLLLPCPPRDPSRWASRFSEVERFLRRGEQEKAREIADSVTLGTVLGLSNSEVGDMHEACEFLRRIRVATFGEQN